MITLFPTHGRTYRSQEAALEDLRNGELFACPNGRFITIKSFPILLKRFKKIALFYDTINGEVCDVTEVKPALIPKE